MWNPISHGKSVGRPLGCAGREVRVGAVRVRMTFLWMSDLTFAYFDLKALLPMLTPFSYSDWYRYLFALLVLLSLT